MSDNINRNLSNQIFSVGIYIIDINGSDDLET